MPASRLQNAGQRVGIIAATHSAGLTSTMAAALPLGATARPTSPSPATRPAFFVAAITPFLRSQSIAAVSSPLTSGSLSAALHSIMGAPVAARSSFTISAVTFTERGRRAGSTASRNRGKAVARWNMAPRFYTMTIL